MPALPISRRPGRCSSGRAAPRGAATLVVVMVLFFIVALVAAYASRNLIFEQRTSANQYRATQAFEAAEAGLEWALTQLNGGRISAGCVPRVDPATADDSFRQRYLDIAPDSGLVTARSRPDGTPRQAACVFTGTDWQCSCPADAAPALAAPVGAGPFPAFVLRFHDRDLNGFPYPAAVVRIESTGCTVFFPSSTNTGRMKSSAPSRCSRTRRLEKSSRRRRRSRRVGYLPKGIVIAIRREMAREL